MEKREQLQNAIGQSKLLEIIDGAYEHAETCANCRALMEWWEKHGSSMPGQGVLKDGRKGRR